jgi:sugar O-acyltransferase (sialic acid O-acetyltransferase NeuD family)
VKRLIILGAESLGREAADIAIARGYRSVEFLDDRQIQGERILGFCVTGGFAAALKMIEPEHEFFVAVGTPGGRARWMKEISDAGGRLVTLVHPRAEVSPFAKIGLNSMVSFGCHIASNALLGDGNILWSSVVISHDCSVGNFCFFSPMVASGGYTHIGNYAMFGCGCKLRSCITIGDRVVIGMGAVVARSIAADHFVAAGSDPVPIEGKSAEDIFFGRVRTLPREAG